jgi:hypothetical protein
MFIFERELAIEWLDWWTGAYFSKLIGRGAYPSDSQSM